LTDERKPLSGEGVGILTKFWKNHPFVVLLSVCYNEKGWGGGRIRITIILIRVTGNFFLGEG